MLLFTVAGTAPKRCNQRSLPCSSVVEKCISISSFFCFCISFKNSVSTLKSYVANTLFFTSIFPFPLPFFFKMVCAPGCKKNETKQQPYKNGEMETRPESLWSGAEKAWRQRCSALPTRQVCNITLHCFRSVEFSPQAKGWSAWIRCWLQSFKGMVQDFENFFQRPTTIATTVTFVDTVHYFVDRGQKPSAQLRWHCVAGE